MRARARRGQQIPFSQLFSSRSSHSRTWPAKLNDCKLTPTIEYSFKRGIRFHHFSPGYVAAGVHQGLEAEKGGDSLDLADTHHNTVFNSGSTLLTRLSVRVKRKSEEVPMQLSAMAVAEKTGARLQTTTGQTASPINNQGMDERGVHVQKDGYRPVIKIGARRASWLAPSAAGAVGGPAAQAAIEGGTLGGANNDVETAPSPFQARGSVSWIHNERKPVHTYHLSLSLSLSLFLSSFSPPSPLPPL